LAEAKAVAETASRMAEAGGLAGPAIHMIGVRAAIEHELGDTTQAEALARDALALTRRANLDEHPFSATAHVVHGRTQARQGNASEASAEIERGIELAERVNAWHVQTYGVLALAEIRHSAHEPAEARRLLGRARAIVGALRDADELAGARIEQTERTLHLRPTRAPDAGAAPYWELSERELAVLRLLPSRLSQREIAAELYVSLNTVKTHMRSIFRKLGVASREEAVTRARARPPLRAPSVVRPAGPSSRSPGMSAGLARSRPASPVTRRRWVRRLGRPPFGQYFSRAAIGGSTPCASKDRAW
jgi:LuxR family maltose regulon positive regulatory protein